MSNQNPPRHVYRDDEGPQGITVRNPNNLPKNMPPTDIPLHIEVPQIWYLPIGTNVALLPNSTLPKGRPWTIRDLEPRHHVYPNFDNLDRRTQKDLIYVHGYLPYDLFGNAVLCREDPRTRRYKHVFMGDEGWENPVMHDMRTDAPKVLGGPPESDDEEAGARRASERGAEQAAVHASAPTSPHAVRRESVNGGAPAAGGGSGFTAANR